LLAYSLARVGGAVFGGGDSTAVTDMSAIFKAVADPIVIVDYDPRWPEQFARLRDRAQSAMGELAVSIEHVGSTAVPGLPAKPVIDMVVVIASDEDLPEAIERLAVIGYSARGDLGVPGREAFSWPEGETRHHLYVSPTTSEELRAQVRFRDLLLSDPRLAANYVALKRELAATYRDDRPSYTDGKTDFIAAALGSSSAELTNADG
jgi:GrpB-like predicted nucleotidyltransferase (UPF0157 family)